MITRTQVVAFATAALVTALSSAGQTSSTLFVGRYVTSDGTLAGGAVITLNGAKISSITDAGTAPSGEDVASYPTAVLSPGLIDLASTLSSHASRTDLSRSIDPDVSAIHAIDWTHRDFAAALAGGMTAALIAPQQDNLISGAATVIKTAAAHRTVVRHDGPLTLALGPNVWRYDRAPTSRSGSLAMLREAFDTARAGAGSARLQAVVSGDQDTMFFCAAAMDVSAALRALAQHPPRALVYTGDEQDLAVEFADLDTVAVVGPYAFDTPPATLAFAGALSAAGVPVALAGQFPQSGRDSMRMTAALAVRYGMTPEAARQALTITAARAAGVDERIGRIAPGYDADLVIFSDDPLRLDARVLAVYIDGARVYADLEPNAGR